MIQFCYLRLYLGIETVSCRCFATDGMDGHELKFEKDGPTFSSFNANASKKEIKHQKNLRYRSIWCLGQLALCNDLTIELT